MKNVKRVFAVVLAVIMSLGIFAVSVSAAPAAPKFALKVKSQSSTKVTLTLSLVSGSFNSVDIGLKVSGPIGACESITMTNEFKSLKSELEDNYGTVLPATNKDTLLVSIASTSEISKSTSIFDFTFKKSSKNVTTSDFKATVSNCVLTVGDNNVDLTSGTKVVTEYIDFNTTSITANYKETKKIDFSSSYSAKQIKWESSNTKVATVDENGNVKMTGKGTATITAKSTDGKASAECKVTVKYAWWQWIIKIVLLGFLWY